MERLEVGAVRGALWVCVCTAIQRALFDTTAEQAHTYTKIPHKHICKHEHTHVYKAILKALVTYQQDTELSNKHTNAHTVEPWRRSETLREAMDLVTAAHTLRARVCSVCCSDCV